MSIACVVIPVYKKPSQRSELLAIRHIDAYLSEWPRVIVHPESYIPAMRADYYLPFHNKYFQNVQAYSSLMLSEKFYRSFDAYEYILIYQLDCLVFSDSLLRWCNAGYDYIGAPVLYDKRDQKSAAFVGNGGLSLRRVSAFMRVLTSERYVKTRKMYISDFLSASIPDSMHLPLLKRLRTRARILREVRVGSAKYASKYTLNEDLFWSHRARLFDQQFRIAPLSLAAQFSWENAPRMWAQKTGLEIPFGCHAWEKWDQDYWEPFLLGL